MKTARIAEPLRRLAEPIAGLAPDPRNARRHPERNLEAIRRSLERFGQVKPIVVRAQDGAVMCGNATLAAALALGWDQLAVVRLELTEDQARALAIADNRTAELAEWDPEELRRTLQQLEAAGVGHDELGFLDRDLRRLLNLDAPTAADGPAPPAAGRRPRTRRGDLWLLGGHRLLCGDATSASDVRRACGGLMPKLCATDPPYAVGYGGPRAAGGKDWSGDYAEVPAEDALRFYRATFAAALEVLAPASAIYCWHAHRRYPQLAAAWAELGIVDAQTVVWVKPCPTFGQQHWLQRHELALVGWRRGAPPAAAPGPFYWLSRHEVAVVGWRRGRRPDHDLIASQDSVWLVDWEGAARNPGDAHPCQKPVELFARPMRKHTLPSDAVLEPFCGSGSQILAAEQLGRRCLALEISPTFCDAAVDRWEAATGRLARLAGKIVDNSGRGGQHRPPSPGSKTFPRECGP